jgi:hypothetical protein
MIRLLGFLVGSAVSIGLFLLILGMPDINLSNQLINDEQIESVAEKGKKLRDDLEAIATEVIDEMTAEEKERVSEQETALIDESPPTELPAPEMRAEEPAPEPVIETLTPEEAQIVGLSREPDMQTPADELAQSDLKWHAFWNPFRSRLAAEGFVGQLEKVTGLDYRVVKIKTGVYEVTFAYADDAERRSKMSLIASATGLDLPEM